MTSRPLTILALSTIIFGSGVLAFASGPRPDYVGFMKCLEHHPDKYCRTINNMPPRF